MSSIDVKTGISFATIHRFEQACIICICCIGECAALCIVGTVIMLLCLY